MGGNPVKEEVGERGPCCTALAEKHDPTHTIFGSVCCTLLKSSRVYNH